MTTIRPPSFHLSASVEMPLFFCPPMFAPALSLFLLKQVWTVHFYFSVRIPVRDIGKLLTILATEVVPGRWGVFTMIIHRT